MSNESRRGSWIAGRCTRTRCCGRRRREPRRHGPGRPVPGLRSVGETAAHIVRGRVLHVQRALGAEAAELLPLAHWDDRDDPPRSAAEIVAGRELTWRYITACMARWAALGWRLGRG